MHVGKSTATRTPVDQQAAASSSPHAIISGHRHSLPLQNKVNELNLKCSCNVALMHDIKAPTEKSILERKQNVLLDDRKVKIIRSRKEKRDAATSPQLPNKNGTKLENGGGESPSCRSVSTARPSPRREIPMRNAATSPQREKQLSGKLITTNEQQSIKPVSPKPNTGKPITPNKQNNTHQIVPKTVVTSKPIKNPIATKILLEKSKSLSDTRPARQLRTTRSLSPRPPVRQQQAIIISDENDIVQVQVTPSEYFDDDDEVFGHHHEQSLKTRKPRGKAQSENTSPNLSNCGAIFFADDRYANNRSTGCLVYVPSDPWMKQPLSKDDHHTDDKKQLKNARSATLKDKSNNLKSFDNDPWIYRRTDSKMHSPSKLCRQSKSMSSNIDEDTTKLPAAATANRPKLQRTKTAGVSDDLIINCTYMNRNKHPYEYGSLTMSADNKITLNTQKKSHKQISPQKQPQPVVKVSTKTASTKTVSNNKASTVSPTICATATGLDQKRAQNFLLNVNTNMLQPRHSFSTLLPQKDDELQLNIRRLSEQIKTPTIGYQSTIVTNSSASDFSNYLNQMKQQQNSKMVIPTATAAAAATTKDTTNNLNHSLCNETDIVLETTC